MPRMNLYDIFWKYLSLRTEVNSTFLRNSDLQYPYINHLYYNLIFILSTDFFFYEYRKNIKQARGFQWNVNQYFGKI